MGNNYIQDPLDESNFIKCEYKYNNCDTCNITQCLSCKNGFTFIDGNKLNCFEISDLGNKYIQDPLDESNFIKCENKYNNCHTCNITQCLSCKTDFTFVNGNKSNCIEISDLGNKYVQDPLDESNFIKCENRYNNCDTCNITQCLSCKTDFTFINGNKSNCIEISDLGNKYVQDPLDPTNYIKCEEKYKNCDTCNTTQCLSCKDDFTFIDGNKLTCLKKTDLNSKYVQDPLDQSNYIKCENKYNYCDTCNNNECISCKNGFTFINGNKLNCVKTSDLNNTYVLDPSDESNYIKCENKYNNCDTCNTTQCLSCKDDFIFVDGNKLTCLKKTDLNSKYVQDPLDQSNYIKCENKYNYCDTCNNNECISCKNGFTFINGNKLNCVKTSDLNNTYVLDPSDESNYIKCENKYDNCDTCNTTQCLSCKTDFTFIDGNKSNCLKKTDLNNKYVQDPSDESNYIKCENKYNNCDTCNNRQCFSCKNDFIFINDDYTKCHLKSDIDLQFYFTNDNNMYYSCNLIKYWNKKECKKLFNEINPEEQEKSLAKQLYILQVQIINKLLKIFLTLSENISNGFHIKLTINIFKNSTRQRNLQESSESQEVDFYLDNISGNIATLTSQEKFDENDRVVVNKEQSNDDYELNVLNNDNNILDTLENKKKIENNEIVDFSEINSDIAVNKYYIDSSSTGCSFNLVSNDSIKESNKEIYLTFIEKNDTNNNINAKCILSSDNEKNIPCSLEQKQAKKDFDLKSYVGTNGSNLFYIYQHNDSYQLSCYKKRSDNDEEIIIITTTIIAAVVVVVAIIITIYCCYCKKKKVVNIEKIDNSEKNFKISKNKINSISNNFSTDRDVDNKTVNKVLIDSSKKIK